MKKRCELTEQWCGFSDAKNTMDITCEQGESVQENRNGKETYLQI